jgi:hypothetical protein
MRFWDGIPLILLIGTYNLWRAAKPDVGLPGTSRAAPELKERTCENGYC